MSLKKTEKKELLSGTLVLEGKTKERLTERRMYRRNRRNRLRYREPRFDNRIRSEGWLPPSVQRRFDAHIRLINLLRKYLPVKNVIVETGKFDIQKLENPEIFGIEYQQGPLFEYYNLRAFITTREKNRCQLCGKEISRNDNKYRCRVKMILKYANRNLAYPRTYLEF